MSIVPLDDEADRRFINSDPDLAYNAMDSIDAQAALQSHLKFAEKIGLFRNIAGRDIMGVISPGMKQVMEQAYRLQQNPQVAVLIEGETGTGKELLARYIHYGCLARSNPFIAINCAAISPAMFESELFGYEAGSFTGGLAKGKKGKLDMANGGTLFLDEISELPLELQAKLLRVIQEKEYYRVGGLHVVQANVRFITATNRKIEDWVANGRFREDLYYRLNLGLLKIPPLRQRQEAILPLAMFFLTNFQPDKSGQFRISQEAGELMQGYDWPGNVRQLRNEMERIAMLSDDLLIMPHHLSIKESRGTARPADRRPVKGSFDLDTLALPPDCLSLEELTNAILKKALEMHGGNRTKTAQYLGISRSALIYRLKKME